MDRVKISDMKMELIKRENASDLVLILMISALTTLLLTRFFLELFGWPTISFGVWHIAHVNWGGLGMVLGAILALTNHGEKVRRLAAIITGAGWGLFIDEVGKYLTKNNDYWFQPAIIFIYVSFIGLFLVYRYLEKHKPQDPKTLLYAVINKLEDVAEGDLDAEEKEALLKKLDKIIKIEKDEGKKVFAKDLKTFILSHTPKEVESKKFLVQLLKRTGYFSYNRIFKRKIVLTGLSIYAGLWSLDRIQETVRIMANSERLQTIQRFYSDYNFFSTTDVYMITFKIIADSIVSLLFLAGIYKLIIKKRAKGIQYFQWGLIISIFLSSVFKFYFEQFSEVFVLITSIVLLIGTSQLKREIAA